MSITAERQIDCPCGASVLVTVVESLNASRHPALRQAVLDRSLHTARCATCGALTVIAARFAYVDLERRQMIGVYLADDRREERICGQEVVDTYQRCFLDGPPII